jgi:hypothetical protein
MKFSIILNSRKRVELLSSFLTSIYEHTSNLDDVEVLISLDEDDEDSQSFLVNHTGFGPNVLWEVIERDSHLNNRLTGLAQQAFGKYIFILNDDTEILTHDWDKIAFEELEKVPSEIVYGYTHCNSVDKERDAKYSSFPIVSKRSVDILGYFMHPAFHSLGGDVHLWRIYNAINSVVDIPIQIKHSLHETVEQVLTPDETAQDMRSKAGGVNWWTLDITEDVEKLKNAQINSSI